MKKENGKYVYIDENFNEEEVKLDDFSIYVDEKIGYPVFVKPSRCGSSVGINKVNKRDELINYISYASSFDNEILIEKAHDVREIECAILKGNASTVGEIIPYDEFYSYDEKYKNNKTKIKIPADVTSEEMNNIKKIAEKVFRILNCKDLSRIDFFIDKNTNEIYVNEINTLPGFTSISMYPKMLEYDGLSYSELLDKLVD